MKSGTLVLLDEYQGIKNLLTIAQTKEVFVKGSFIEDCKLLIAITKDISQNFTIILPNKGIKIIGNYEDYIKHNQNLIHEIKEYANLNGLDLSWLEIAQLTEMHKVENDVKFNLIKLGMLYQKVLLGDKELSFLDF